MFSKLLAFSGYSVINGPIGAWAERGNPRYNNFNMSSFRIRFWFFKIRTFRGQ